ncbi:4'-phosphopantetheinyl transferase [Rhodococcoides trifolii]|uniref:4'-phosphopantetheinyl transferase n=1 Tax=Rhodococcoides trifolii TaxID=908250 RepID=A0A917D0X2_9NOCA|nr:4'-phosphopantetheinyl transferase [Rhodococcus trifolii]GGG07676.1 4'-phosphopantetheinyl transferase [Rhodococcus trifolii]
MIERILPGVVVAEELFEDPPGLTPHPREEHLIAKAVEKRRREFVSARYCARKAMTRLGVDQAPILRGEMGSPQWPSGVVGSLTHTDGYRAAALGHALAVRSIGIDAEPHEALPDGVLDAVSIEQERSWLSTVQDGAVHWDKLLFCAKEATYKAWFPLTGRWLGFEDAHITFAKDAPTGAEVITGTFHTDLLVPGNTTTGPPLSSFDGRWVVARGLVVTAITVI